MNRDITFYILTPVYKVEQYIDECIKSVLSQTYQNFKFILVDDGSPDRSGKICDEYANKDARINVIHKNNQGQISARQAAIDYSKKHFQTKGKNNYFVFLDSDDYLNKNTLSVIASTIICEDCDMVVYGMNRVSDRNIISHINGCHTFVGNIIDKQQLYSIVFQDFSYNSLWRKALMCDLISDEDYSKYYHIRHGEDLLESIPVYKACKKVSFIKESLYNYRVNLSSITHSIKYENYVVDSTVRREVWDFLQSENVFDEKNWDDYKEYCEFLIEREILMISQFATSYMNKAHLFDQINSDTYYKNIIKDTSFATINWLLKYRYYRIILIYSKLRMAASKILGFVRRTMEAISQKRG